MNYQLTSRGQQADLGDLSPKKALALQVFQGDITSNVATISQTTGLSHGESASAVRELLKAGLIAPEESEQSFVGKMLSKLRR